ncbi:MAG: hypothetical protein GAK30_02255 [Paracidovorax wautersii]|uniref:YCII-related domain-containing protein n=1 Tax=Paracidovorax wautersii TaxID=1177982 RepID=A0A7V8FNG1_9BURK|nr:MAG: hypothetical protein GAK30_02255 [Paracidovorax wautersii]
MIYILTLKYIRPPEEVRAHIDTHRHWLAQHIQAGRILAAGPLEDRSGGLVIATCSNRAELDGMIAEDTFVVHQVAEVSVQSFEPTIRAPALPQQWAMSAAVVAAPAL